MVTADYHSSQSPAQLQPNGTSNHAGTRWEELLAHALSRHSKVFAVGFRLLRPSGYLGPIGTESVQAFVGQFAALLAERHLDPHLLWLRKQALPGQPSETTVLLLLDGHRTQSAVGHLALAATVWASVLGRAETAGLVAPWYHGDGSSGMQIRRDHPEWQERLGECRRWGQGLVPPGCLHGSACP